ncbi:hypothetical protein [Parasitella parasitica]|uniref:Casein kinase II subunit beta n=1 Tax=Parasitella parasitica TaxID=35722 RepID=A0A0B7NGX4_9FUNG|nr:hypothetical protein [Parasitella parasitica]
MDSNVYDSNLDDSLSSSSGSSLQSWISWFCSLSGHEFYVEVPKDFIDDEFNLTGLSAVVPYYTQALEIILDVEYGEFFDPDDEDEDEEEQEQGQDEYDLSQIENYYNNARDDDDFWREDDKTHGRLKTQDLRIIEPNAFMLYGLIHQRYLLTRSGLRLMAERYSSGQFGTCPRYHCNDSPVLPMGQFDETGRERVRLYCPRCLDIYNPPSSIHRCVDGAHFGSTYCNLLFLTYPELVPSPNSHIYQPRIFGFRVNPKSIAGPRNQWLRMRPLEYINDDDDEDDDDEDKDAVQVDDNEKR